MQRTFETNVFGVVRVLHEFLPLVARSSLGIVVNVSSSLASLHRASTPQAAGYGYPGVAYPASKTALNMLTVQYAKAFPDLRINSVEPGFTATGLNGMAGHQTVEQGAAAIVAMAQIGRDGPTGGFYTAAEALPW